MSSTCQAKVALHMPKYKYGVLTPGKPFDDAGSRRVRAEGKEATFHAVVSSVNREPGHGGEFQAPSNRRYRRGKRTLHISPIPRRFPETAVPPISSLELLAKVSGITGRLSVGRQPRRMRLELL